MNLKIGNKVKLQEFKDNSYIEFARDMHQYIGKITKIRALTSCTYLVEGNVYEWINLKKIKEIQNKLK